MKQTIAVSNLSRFFNSRIVDLFDFDQRTIEGVGIVIQGNEHKSEHWIRRYLLNMLFQFEFTSIIRKKMVRKVAVRALLNWMK
jgi:hypothetical protein